MYQRRHSFVLKPVETFRHLRRFVAALAGYILCGGGTNEAEDEAEDDGG